MRMMDEQFSEINVLFGVRANLNRRRFGRSRFPGRQGGSVLGLLPAPLTVRIVHG